MFGGLKAIYKHNIANDVISGIIIALVSIPISMGYAQIAGLPAVYGLYGSVLPVLVFAIMSSSPQYIFGVDAAPAAIIGGIISNLGIAAGSREAMSTVPLLAFYTGVWLLIFYIFKAGRLTEYVSTPVMGGFVSGICATIILMQIPKLFGGVSGTGEIHHLVMHIAGQAKHSFNLKSLVLGIVCIVLILVSKRFVPKFPMSVALMLASAGVEYLTGFSAKNGISTLPGVDAGLGGFVLPDFTALSPIQGMSSSLAVAVVIMAETLLAENSFAMKNDYDIDDNNEVLTFGICNIAAAFIGCCPVNGSVSRTAMHEQFKGKSQLSQIVAVVAMAFILLFCTGFIRYLPVPVLTAIIICALLGAIEFDLFKKLRKINKKEMWIFVAAFAGVLVFGTIAGVIIGVILSFVNVVMRESDPPRTFLGVVNGRGGFFDLNSNSNARPIKNVVIYRFRANLFFANVKEFRGDIEGAIKADTKCVIVDAGGIASIDTTGADTLEGIYNSLKQKGIRFYLAEHMHTVNDQLRELGLGYIIEEGGVRRTISAALRAQGYTKPYPLDDDFGAHGSDTGEPNFKLQLMHEFEWAFGDLAGQKIDEYTDDILRNAANSDIGADNLLSLTNLWAGLGDFDEDILLESLELRLDELSTNTGIDRDELAHRIEQRRERIYQHVKVEDEESFKILRTRRHDRLHLLREHSPELYDALCNYHQEIVDARHDISNARRELKEVIKNDIEHK